LGTKFVRLGLSRITLIFVAIHYGTGSICHNEIAHGNFRSILQTLSHFTPLISHCYSTIITSTVHDLTRVAVRFDSYHNLKMIKHQARSLSNPYNLKQKYDTSTGASILYS